MKKMTRFVCPFKVLFQQIMWMANAYKMHNIILDKMTHFCENHLYYKSVIIQICCINKYKIPMTLRDTLIPIVLLLLLGFGFFALFSRNEKHNFFYFYLYFPSIVFS